MTQPTDLQVKQRAVRLSNTGVWLLLAEIVMLFVAFTSAMVVRKAAAGDWEQVTLPAVFAGSTLLLLAGTLFMELARRSARALAEEPAMRSGSGPWLAATLLCGLGFLICQWLGFHQLAARGMNVASGPAM